MAIDIRANVTCSLGTLISASISDDYVQGTGLIKCKGSCEISGTITPAIGTVVTFSYTKDGVTRSVPRKLRVMSSFADPFRRTTKVELGCKLTYLQDLRPAPTVDGEPSVETGKRQQCLNGYIEFSANSAYGVPIAASGLMDTCLTKLGITASSNPLTNRFYREQFDFSPGYVTVLSDLLVSESYCGYLDTSEELQVFSLDQDGGTGPVIDSAKIIDIAGIGVGDLPGDAVVVRYEAMKLKEDLENEDPTLFDQRNWTEDIVVGDKETAEVRYEGNGGTYVASATYIPYSQTINTYGEDNSWDENTCVLVSIEGEGADLSDTVIKRVTTKNVILAQEANDYCAQVLSIGGATGLGEEGLIEIVETYEYDNKGQVVRQVSETTEPFFAWAGRLNMQYVYGNSFVNFNAFGSVLTEKVVTEVTTLYADLPVYFELKPGETYERKINGQKTVTSTYRNWALTQQGQQAIAAIGQNAPFADAQSCAAFLNKARYLLVLDDSSVQTSRDRTLVGIERRPPSDVRLGSNDSANSGREFKSELLYTTGSPTSSRIIELSMPYQSDDYYSATGAIVKGDAEAKALRYGRTQNRLLLGNRSGMNIQLEPELLPAAPFSPIVVQANGLSALYRANGTSWTMSSDGILVSTDALFWGAVGGTGTFWFPVAPGITTLPTTPPVVDGQMTVTSVVPVWNETVKVQASTRLGLVATRLPYALELLTEVAPLGMYPQIAVQRLQIFEVPSASTFMVAAETPRFEASTNVYVPSVSDTTLDALVPQVGREIGVYVIPPAADSTIEALLPVAQPALQIRPPAANTALAANVPAVGRFVGTYVEPPNTTITVAAQAPSL